MIFLLTGEGPTDIGTCVSGATVCEAPDFAPGPMALFINKIVETHLNYSIIDYNAVRFISESQLAASATELKSAKKMRLPGAKTHKETRYFFNTARLLAKLAKQLETRGSDDVVAVLFRDSDGTASAGRGVWTEKRQSIIDGFMEENFERGVPMIPKPKSEAWLICALKKQPYLNCSPLEDRSGNDNSPNSLKNELDEILEEPVTRELLVRVFEEQKVSAEKIDMPSFKVFVTALQSAIGVPRTSRRHSLT